MISSVQPQLSLPRRRGDGHAGFVLSSSPAAGFQHFLFSYFVYLGGLLSSPWCRQGRLQVRSGPRAAQGAATAALSSHAGSGSPLAMKIASSADSDKAEQTNSAPAGEFGFLLGLELRGAFRAV